MENNKKELNEEIITANLDTLINFCWNKKNLEILKSISSENIKLYVNNIAVANNVKEVEANMNVTLSGFPDLVLKINKLYIINNVAFMQWIMIGTNTGIYGEFPATGKKIKISGLSHISFNQQGKIIEENIFFNELDLLQQLGYRLKPPTLE